jgi:maltose alpha-D-glucosyltransferase/alpha-amylase
MGLHDSWYENAIYYCLDVETFADSNGDGVGDFPGLISRLDYLAGLGVTCLWLMPFYPTPGRDDGYDVSDYAAIDPRLGTMADFTEFMVEANERGLHVIIDLVPNHTSTDHPWFQAARRDPLSSYRDYYIWRQDDPGDTSDHTVFPGVEEGIWSYDDMAGAWYLHHFYDFQADLNFANPAVREEFRKVVGLWLALGVDGFRIDAAPFLISPKDVSPEKMGVDMAHDLLKELADFAVIRKGTAILLGEVDVELSTISNYFGGGNELHALFNFPLNRMVFLALAQESADPIKVGLTQLPAIPQRGQWVNFLRHHDEVNLERLTANQREQIYAAFGPDASMQIYGRGLRRRLAPMLEGDPARLKLAFSLLFALPGAPMMFYGDEIGMGDDLSLKERLSVRTPMQWTPYANGGFSNAPAGSLVRPIIADGPFGFDMVNVARLRADSGSLLNWMAQLARTRKECPEIGTGEGASFDTGNEAVLGMRYTLGSSTLVIVNNLSRSRRTVTLPLTADEIATATELFSDRPYAPLDPSSEPKFQLEPFGYRWIRVDGIY